MGARSKAASGSRSAPGSECVDADMGLFRMVEKYALGYRSGFAGGGGGGGGGNRLFVCRYRGDGGRGGEVWEGLPMSAGEA
jgi:hypothetical protein